MARTENEADLAVLQMLSPGKVEAFCGETSLEFQPFPLKLFVTLDK
jgi:hypothetical protein